MSVQFTSVVADLAAIAERAVQHEIAGRAALAAAPTLGTLGSVGTPAAKGTGSDIFFAVTKQPIALLTAAEGSSKVDLNSSGLGLQARLPQYVATTRDDGLGHRRMLGIVGKDYHVVPMRDVVDGAEAGLRAALGDAKVDKAKVRDKVSYGGARVYREYVIPTGDRIIQNPNSKHPGTTVAFKVQVANSYDGSSTVSVASGTIDLICTNGMMGFVATDRSVVRHSKTAVGFDWERVVRHAFAAFRVDVEMAQEWARTEVSEAEARARLERLKIGPRSLEQLVAQFRVEAENRGSSLWALASAITHDATHSQMRQTGQDHAATTQMEREIAAAAAVRKVCALV